MTYPRESGAGCPDGPEDGGGIGPGVLVATSFPTNPEEVAEARAATKEALANHPTYDARLGEQLVSELATNAILHSHSDRFGLVVMLTPAGHARIAVRDSGHGKTRPEMKKPEMIEEGGRGLWLVAALSDDWGVTERRSGGHTVWFELAPQGEGVRAVAGVGSGDGR